MMENTRWEQRFENYLKALIQLENAVKLSEERELTDLEKQGLIQAFEFTHELAWNVIKDYFFFQGNSEIIGSRDATREAFKVGLVQDGDGWMEMIKSRNKTSHTYNEDIASEITEKIIAWYFDLFKEFEVEMLEIKDKK
ncbi:nucleotidyltransferase substrate binding protein [Aquiflexum sp.]|uniref:nucleotidyltransferase substrate binding protein n=1 Tax=Aquiflexum sp. TaxID=1872584 RepID=UPI003593F77A